MTKLDAFIFGIVLVLVTGAVAGITGYEMARSKYEVKP